MYVLFVLIVLVADVYHRAVMLPRIRHETEMRENQRQLEAGRSANANAGDTMNGLSMSLDGRLAMRESVEMGRSTSEGLDGVGSGGRAGGGGIAADDRSHATAPPLGMVDTVDATGCSDDLVQNRALNAVLAALSNYNDDELDDEDFDVSDDSAIGRRCRRNQGWGIESSMESSREWDRPVVLHGADGILARHHHRHPQTDGAGENELGESPYRVMEDMDALDRMCVEDGSIGYPAYNWYGAWHDGKQELAAHFREYWRDIMDDEESGRVEKFLLVCEFPLTCARKVRTAYDVMS